MRQKLDPELVREIRRGREEALRELANSFRVVLTDHHPYSIPSIAKRINRSLSTVHAMLEGRTHKQA